MTDATLERDEYDLKKVYYMGDRALTFWYASTLLICLYEVAQGMFVCRSANYKG